jgi:7-cyano-7-deazaguanine synthase
MTELVVVSGGLDSSTLLAGVIQEYAKDQDVKAISFNYGQRHRTELDYAMLQADWWGVEWEVVDITSITSFLAPGGSALVSDSDVPEGHYGEESMKATVVPNRNMIMASIAAGHAVAIGAKHIWFGVHAGDHFIYPDCRPLFFKALNATIVRGNAGFGAIPEVNADASVWPTEFVMTPFIHWSKNDIAKRAFDYGVRIEDTWSCYKGGDIHCGKCGTCVERLEAIDSTGFKDPTEYEDNTFWREALERSTV